MLVTREMDYAVRVVRALKGDRQASAAEIARREGMQPAITYKVLKALMKAEITGSRRGPDGGYFLLRPCGELTLWDLFHALGEDLLLTECLEPGYLCSNNAGGCCGVHREFCRIQGVLEQELKRTPLSRLMAAEDGTTEI